MTELQKRKRAAKQNNTGLFITSASGVIGTSIFYMLTGDTNILPLTAIMTLSLAIAVSTRE
jgi:hypothetical protein